MKYLKPIILIFAIAVASLLLYAWYTREDWHARERCADCEALETQKLQRLTGTVEKLQNGKTVFTDQVTGLKYELIPCDLKCDNNLNKWFDKIGFTDNKLPVLFDIEGSFDTNREVFIYNSAILLDTKKSGE